MLIPIGSGEWPADAIGSVLGGTHDEVEIIVLANPGAGTPPSGELSAGLPGIRRIDVSPGAPGDPPSSAWEASPTSVVLTVAQKEYPSSQPAV